MEGLPPRPGRPGGAQPDLDQPARDELRGLRRWVLVAGVWAVAATAIALIALLDSSDQDAQKEAQSARGGIAAAERKLDRRIDTLEGRLEDLPGADDVTRLEQRLSSAERGASKAGEDVKSADEAVEDLEKRVKALEDAPDADSAGDLPEP